MKLITKDIKIQRGLVRKQVEMSITNDVSSQVMKRYVRKLIKEAENKLKINSVD